MIIEEQLGKLEKREISRNIHGIIYIETILIILETILIAGHEVFLLK